MRKPRHPLRYRRPEIPVSFTVAEKLSHRGEKHEETPGKEDHR